MNEKKSGANKRCGAGAGCEPKRCLPIVAALLVVGLAASYAVKSMKGSCPCAAESPGSGCCAGGESNGSEER